MPKGDRQEIVAALLAAMRPIASMLLRVGIGYREFADVCKTAFVLAATDEFGVRGRPTNVSRVAAMTGLTRKEVRRIRSLAEGQDLAPAAVRSPPAEVLHCWYTDPRFTGASGEPNVLPYEGPGHSFCELVRSCAGDIPPGAIRSELRRVGALIESPDGQLAARRRYYIPGEPGERLVEGLGFGLRTLATTVAHNAAEVAGNARRFQRLVHNRLIPVERRQEVEAALCDRLTEFSEEIDDYFAEVEVADPADRCNIGIGLYYFEDEPRREAARPGGIPDQV